jgi:multidrug efflux pump subunit AcrA (membrane-fusion protein)
MTQDTDTPATPTAQKQALLEAFDTVLKRQAEVREAELRDAEARRRARRRVRPAIAVAAVLSAVLCSYLYIERPEWLFPAAAIPESVTVKEASLRIGMANVAQHVERHRQRTGSLPRTLAEAGTRVDGMTYEPLGAAWRLVGENGGIELTLRSQDSLPAFLGNSFEVISRRPR